MSDDNNTTTPPISDAHRSVLERFKYTWDTPTDSVDDVGIHSKKVISIFTKKPVKLEEFKTDEDDNLSLMSPQEMQEIAFRKELKELYIVKSLEAVKLLTETDQTITGMALMVMREGSPLPAMDFFHCMAQNTPEMLTLLQMYTNSIQQQYKMSLTGELPENGDGDYDDDE